MRMKCEQFIPDRLRDYYTAKISLSNRSSPALSSVVTAVVSVTTVISENHQVSRIMSGQSLERVQVDPQILRFVIDRDSPTAKFIQKFQRRQTADFGAHLQAGRANTPKAESIFRVPPDDRHCVSVLLERHLVL